MAEKKIEQVIFYTIEKTIKTYRQFAQKELKRAGLRITVDQWLTLKALHDHPGISQKDLAERVFKDNASITRIIELLVKQKFILRKQFAGDKRRSVLTITPAGSKLISKAAVTVRQYRLKALGKINENELKKTGKLLNTITKNCNL